MKNNRNPLLDEEESANKKGRFKLTKAVHSISAEKPYSTSKERKKLCVIDVVNSAILLGLTVLGAFMLSKGWFIASLFMIIDIAAAPLTKQTIIGHLLTYVESFVVDCVTDSVDFCKNKIFAHKKTNEKNMDSTKSVEMAQTSTKNNTEKKSKDLKKNTEKVKTENKKIEKVRNAYEDLKQKQSKKSNSDLKDDKNNNDNEMSL